MDIKFYHRMAALGLSGSILCFSLASVIDANRTHNKNDDMRSLKRSWNHFRGVHFDLNKDEVEMSLESVDDVTFQDMIDIVSQNSYLQQEKYFDWILHYIKTIFEANPSGDYRILAHNLKALKISVIKEEDNKFTSIAFWNPSENILVMKDDISENTFYEMLTYISESYQIGENAKSFKLCADPFYAQMGPTFLDLFCRHLMNQYGFISCTSDADIYVAVLAIVMGEERFSDLFRNGTLEDFANALDEDLNNQKLVDELISLIYQEYLYKQNEGIFTEEDYKKLYDLLFVYVVKGLFDDEKAFEKLDQIQMLLESSPTYRKFFSPTTTSVVLADPNNHVYYNIRDEHTTFPTDYLNDYDSMRVFEVTRNNYEDEQEKNIYSSVLKLKVKR